jgi:hypothetical protein
MYSGYPTGGYPMGGYPAPDPAMRPPSDLPRAIEAVAAAAETYGVSSQVFSSLGLYSVTQGQIMVLVDDLAVMHARPNMHFLVPLSASRCRLAAGSLPYVQVAYEAYDAAQRMAHTMFHQRLRTAADEMFYTEGYPPENTLQVLRPSTPSGLSFGKNSGAAMPDPYAHPNATPVPMLDGANPNLWYPIDNSRRPCSVCNRIFTLREDGTMRKHRCVRGA